MKYKTILADPPWKYGKGFGYGAGEYYELMELEDIMKLPIKNITDDNAHLYLWCPNGLLPQGLKVMNAWGFTFKTVITWVKNRSIFGYYFKGQSEQLLFGVKGTLEPQDKSQVTILNGKVGEHSSKPLVQYAVIEKVSPPPRVELFARTRRQGWDVFGDEVPAETQVLLKQNRIISVKRENSEFSPNPKSEILDFV